ncbi:MAG TPA: DUF1839 family protein [Acidimicrobiales bacterium]|jgi:hypothetical protein
MQRLLAIDPHTYQPHALHHPGRCWTETNCYVDVWVEVLHALGLDPLAAGAFTLSADFEGDQWSFFKIPPEDLRSLYGIEVSEMNAWRPIVDHLCEQLAMGRLLTVEVDSWFLPDTHGVSYRTGHTKSTIVPQAIDLGTRRLGYFHNAGYFELDGDDFDGVLRIGDEDPWRLAPYVELIRLERLRAEGPSLPEVVDLAASHLARRPPDNPVERLAKRLESDRSALVERGLDYFHEYAFGSCRQCGASAEVAGSFVEWLGARDGGGLDEAVGHFRSLAEGAKALQFGLARMVSGRRYDIQSILDQMAESWDVAMDVLVRRYGG